MDKEKKYELLLGWYQIIGGALGIVLAIWIPINTPFTFSIQYFHLIIGLSLYTFSIVCGISLLKNRKNALNLSLINQFLQILIFSILGFGFRYISGLFFTIGIELTTAKYIFEAGASSWQIEWNWISSMKEIHLNIVAILLIVLIDYIKRLKESKETLSFDIEKEYDAL